MKIINKLVKTFTGALIAFGLLSAGANGVTIIGDTIEGSLISRTSGGSVSTSFRTPSIVRDGIELSGVWEHLDFSQSWKVDVNIIDDTQFFVSFTETNLGTDIANIRTGTGVSLVSIELLSLDFSGVITSVDLDNQVGAGILRDIRFTDDSISIDWVGFHEGGFPSNVFNFSVETDPVPEPSSALLVGLVALVSSVTRRRNK